MESTSNKHFSQIMKYPYHVYFATEPLALPQFEKSELGNLRFLVFGLGRTFHFKRVCVIFL